MGKKAANSIVRAIAQSCRLPFLVLSPVCVLLGAGTAAANQVELNIPVLALALAGALLAHISVNTLNEYHDFNSGLDFNTSRTPFSGGSGALPANPELARTVLAVGIASLLSVFLIGIFFVLQYGWGLAPAGIAGFLLIVTYTVWLNKQPLLCLIAPGIAFGFLMVTGTQFVLEGHYSMLAGIAACVPFLLINNLLLLNQFPDIEADTIAGRFHFPIAYGTRKSAALYGLGAIVATMIIVVAVVTGLLPVISLAALLPMPLALHAYSGAVKHGRAIGKFPRYLASNVAVAIFTPLLLAISLLV